LGYFPLLLLEDSTQHASMDRVASHHHVSHLPNDFCHVLMDASPSKYGVGPLSTFTSTPSTLSKQTLMASMDPIDNPSNIHITNVSSLLQYTLVNGSYSSHVVDDDALVSGSCSSHLIDDLDSLTPLFIDDGNTLHESVIPITLPLDRSSHIPRWVISTIIDATKFIVGPSA
jgi:hypothetical protein